MPIVDNSPASYIPTLDAFLAHWDIVTDAGTIIVLAGGYDTSELRADRINLFAAINAVQSPLNDREQSAAARDLLRDTLVPRVAAFNRAMRDRFAGTVHVSKLPKVPAQRAGEGVLMTALADMRDVWGRVNTLPATGAGSVGGFTAPLVLPGTPGYTLANLTADIAALDAAFTAVGVADRSLAYIRATRDALLSPIRTRLQQYRRAILGRFAPGSPVVESLPAYSPAPGSTPAPFSASGSWIPARSAAVITFVPSVSTNVTQYQLRYSSATTYKSSEESVVTTIPATQAVKEFAVTTGLAATGSMANFKVYALTSDGNERGSNAVKIVRG